MRHCKLFQCDGKLSMWLSPRGCPIACKGHGETEDMTIASYIKTSAAMQRCLKPSAAGITPPLGKGLSSLSKSFLSSGSPGTCRVTLPQPSWLQRLRDIPRPRRLFQSKRLHLHVNFRRTPHFVPNKALEHCLGQGETATRHGIRNLREKHVASACVKAYSDSFGQATRVEDSTNRILLARRSNSNVRSMRTRE